MIPSRRVHPRRQKRRRNPLARDVRDRHRNPTVRQRDVVEIVAANVLSRFIEVCELIVRGLRSLVRQEAQLDLHRKLKLAIHVSLLKRGCVQVRVLNRQRALRGDVHQEIEIVLNEFRLKMKRCDLNDAEPIPRRRHQRRTHHRTNLQSSQTLTGVEPAVFAGVSTQNRVPGFHCAIHNRPADRH